MSNSSDTILREAKGALTNQRLTRHIGVKGKQLKWNHALKKFIRASLGFGVVLLTLSIVGSIIGGIGVVGFSATVLAAVAAFVMLMLFPKMSTPTPEKILKSDLRTLAGKTEIWLEAQRPALPPPAQTVLMEIGTRLDQLSPQLQHLGENDPAANDIRRLVGEHLPEMIASYGRIPAPLRKEKHAGSTPEAQLVSGLSVISKEIDAITRTIARGELDALATRGRYLELKYEGPGDVPTLTRAPE
jgi:hypothetical protein